MADEKIQSKYMRIVHAGCSADEANFFSWFVQVFIFPDTQLPQSTSELGALRSYATSLCFTNEEQWCLLLSGVMGGVALSSSVDKRSISKTLFNGWWRHPAQVAMCLSPGRLQQLLSCSTGTAYTLHTLCSHYRDRGLTTLQKSLQSPLVPIQHRLVVKGWDMKAWQVPMPAAVPAGNMPVVAAWISFQSELQLLEEELSQYKGCVFPEKHGLEADQTPYSYESAGQAWAAASGAVNRASRYMAYSHCKESNESARISSAAAVPQWYKQGVLPHTHTPDWSTGQVPASTLAAESACGYPMPEFVLRAGRKGKALSACDTSMGSLLLWQGKKDEKAPSWVAETVDMCIADDDWWSLTDTKPVCDYPGINVCAVDILGICQGTYKDCPEEVVNNVRHAVYKVVLYSSARGIRYSLFGNALFMWAVMIDEAQQVQLAGPWALNATAPSACQALMIITRLSIKAAHEGKQQPWTMSKVTARHDGLQQEACDVQKTDACPNMASSMTAASAENGGDQESDHELLELHPADTHEAPHVIHSKTLTAAGQHPAGLTAQQQVHVTSEDHPQVVGLLSAPGCTVESPHNLLQPHNALQQPNQLCSHMSDNTSSDSSSSDRHPSIVNAVNNTEQANKRRLTSDSSETEAEHIVKKRCMILDDNRKTVKAQTGRKSAAAGQGSVSLDYETKELAVKANSIKFSQVESVIADGNSGYIFSYRPPGGSGKLWALKVAPEGSDMQQRLQNAGKAMRMLHGIAPEVVAMGQCAEGGYVLATEQIRNCATYNHSQHSSYSDRVKQAVQNMHQAGVMHGNLQPEHILMDDAGKAWLVGFGESSTSVNEDDLDWENEQLFEVILKETQGLEESEKAEEAAAVTEVVSGARRH